MESETKPVQYPIVPLEYAGLWIAWNHERTRIIASGRTIDEVSEAAAAAGESRPVFSKIPRANVRYFSLRRVAVRATSQDNSEGIKP